VSKISHNMNIQDKQEKTNQIVRHATHAVTGTAPPLVLLLSRRSHTETLYRVEPGDHLDCLSYNPTLIIETELQDRLGFDAHDVSVPNTAIHDDA